MSSLHRSNAPPSLEAANQAQIDDLVQRNRTLEYTNNKLSEKLSAGISQSKKAIQDLQKQSHEQEKLIREECEDFLAYYRFVQLRTASALETERLNALAEQKALREEKLLRLQRDFRVVMFYAKERELEERVLGLEEANERMDVERKELASALRKKLAELVAQLKLKDDEVTDLSSERDIIEKDVSKLREDNAQLQTSLASASSKLERITLQLEGAQSSRSELEGVNEELKRKNYDLQRQIDKWQRLEDKSDAELDSVHKRKSELEVELKELRDRLARAKEDGSKALEKEKKRVERAKEAALGWQEAAETHQAELEDGKKEFATLQRELEQLKGRASHEPTPTKSKKAATRTRKSSATDSEAEHEAPKRSRASSRRKKGTASDSETDEVQEIAPPPAKPSRKQKKMSPVMEEDEGVSEIEVVEPQVTPKAKEIEVAKPKPRPRPRPRPVEVPNDEEPVQVPPHTAKNQQKRKASSDDSDVESERPGKKVAKISTKAESSRMMESALKPASRAPSEGPANTAVDPVQKQKKKRINVFAGSGSQSNSLGFDFDLGANGFNIPTTLTPVKEAEGPVPNRAVSGVMSNLGGLIRGRMSGLR